MTKTQAVIESEQVILAAILCGKDFDLSQLSAKEFLAPLHSRLYARLQSMIDREEPVNVLAVMGPMDLSQLEQNDVHKLQDPTFGPFTATNLNNAVRTIKRDFYLRELQRRCEETINANGNGPLTAWEVQEAAKKYLDAVKPASTETSLLTGCSTAELFAAQEKMIDWLCWPFAAVGLASIIDALPKVGKTVFILQAIRASRLGKPFLNYPTKPMRVIYVSEQSRPSLAMQAREIGFTGEEPAEELFWITREDWSRHVYTDFLVKLEQEILQRANYNCLIIDTFHTVGRLEDEKDASEVTRLGNATLDIASRNNLALTLGRHDRKSGGEVGVSGRSSIQLSGLVDVILHLVRVPNSETQRKLELLGRVPALPCEQIIDLMNGSYVNWGAPVAPATDKQEQVNEWIAQNPEITAPQVVGKFAEMSIKVSLSQAKRYCAEARQKGN